jgi:hypothetical protein
MNNTNHHSLDYEANSRKSVVQLRNWTIAWLLSLALAVFGPRWFWEFSTAPTILFVLVNVAVGFGMIWSLKRHMQALDELQRRIMLDACALSLGVGLVCGLAYDMLEDVHLISYQPEISHLVFLMTLTYGVGIVLGNRKVR